VLSKAHPLFVLGLFLLQRDCSTGACVGASAALGALLGVNRILFAFGDCSNGTFVNTCAASNTIVTNYVSHDNLQLNDLLFTINFFIFSSAKITIFGDSDAVFADFFLLNHQKQ